MKVYFTHFDKSKRASCFARRVFLRGRYSVIPADARMRVAGEG